MFEPDKTVGKLWNVVKRRRFTQECPFQSGNVDIAVNYVGVLMNVLQIKLDRNLFSQPRGK